MLGRDVMHEKSKKLRKSASLVSVAMHQTKAHAGVYKIIDWCAARVSQMREGKGLLSLDAAKLKHPPWRDVADNNER